MAKKDFKSATDTYFTKRVTPSEIAQTTPKATLSETAKTIPKVVLPEVEKTTPKVTKRLNLYIEGGLIADIKKIAGLDGKSVNGLICEVLADYAKTKAEAIKAYNEYHSNNE